MEAEITRIRQVIAAKKGARAGVNLVFKN